MSAIPGSFAISLFPNVYVKAIFCEISLKTPTVCRSFWTTVHGQMLLLLKLYDSQNKKWLTLSRD